MNIIVAKSLLIVFPSVARTIDPRRRQRNGQPARASPDGQPDLRQFTASRKAERQDRKPDGRTAGPREDHGEQFQKHMPDRSTAERMPERSAAGNHAGNPESCCNRPHGSRQDRRNSQHVQKRKPVTMPEQDPAADDPGDVDKIPATEDRKAEKIG